MWYGFDWIFFQKLLKCLLSSFYYAVLLMCLLYYNFSLLIFIWIYNTKTWFAVCIDSTVYQQRGTFLDINEMCSIRNFILKCIPCILHNTCIFLCANDKLVIAQKPLIIFKNILLLSHILLLFYLPWGS